MSRMIFLICLLTSFSLSTECQAQILWEYASTEGTTLVTEQMTTAIGPSEEFADAVSFNLMFMASNYLVGYELTTWNTSLVATLQAPRKALNKPPNRRVIKQSKQGNGVSNPEPSTFVSFGLLGLATLVRRKRETPRSL